MVQKDDFIKLLAEKGYTKAAASTIIDDFLGTMYDTLVAGETVMFRGFGSFEVREHAARESTDVKTHERITIPSYKSVRFTPGGKLKRAVKEGFIRQ